jgi:hypothetical protein
MRTSGSSKPDLGPAPCAEMPCTTQPRRFETGFNGLAGLLHVLTASDIASWEPAKKPPVLRGLSCHGQTEPAGAVPSPGWDRGFRERSMATSIPATGEFRTRRNAESAIARLLRAGFDSRSIEAGHDDYGYVVKVHVHPESRIRAQKLIEASPWLGRRGFTVAVAVAVAVLALGFASSWVAGRVFTPGRR